MILIKNNPYLRLINNLLCFAMGLRKRSHAKLKAKQKHITQSQAKMVPNKGPRPRKNKKVQTTQNQTITFKQIQTFPVLGFESLTLRTDSVKN
jgi:hypothetical protein